MNASIPPKGLKEKLEAERAKQLAEKPESLGVRGWMGKGQDAERMAAIAAEIEERESKRRRGGRETGDLETIGLWPDRKKAARETEEETMEGEISQRKGAQKDPRAIPEAINSHWIWRARRAELEETLRTRLGVKDDLGKVDLNELRRMVQARTGRKKGERPKRKANRPCTSPMQGGAARDTKPAESGTIPARPETEKGIAGTNGGRMERAANPLLLYCMRCGFPMEVHHPEEFMQRPAGGGE